MNPYMMLKLNRYLRAGIREYWIVDPEKRALSAYLLKDGQYMINAYGDTDSVPVHVLSGCEIKLYDVFYQI